MCISKVECMSNILKSLNSVLGTLIVEYSFYVNYRESQSIWT